MRRHLPLAVGMASGALLAGCALTPVELRTAVPPSDAPAVQVVDARGLQNPSTVGAQPATEAMLATRPVPDAIHDAVAAALVQHGMRGTALQLTVRVGRFGIDVASQGAGQTTAQAVWGVFVADGHGVPRCAVPVNVAVPVEGSHRAEALQAALDGAAEQAAAAASCPQGLGL